MDFGPRPFLPPLNDEENRHPAVASWFLGPRAENFKYLATAFLRVLHGQKEARVNLYSDDPDFITAKIQANDLFKESMEFLDTQIDYLSKDLSVNSIPFWSPRYNGHMNMDTTMPSLIGYLTTMLYNPNNVALEASPLTTVMEIIVGKQLCQMLGYNVTPDLHGEQVPIGWGHITADGSIANLESIWVARNMKFYPLSLKLAIEEGDLGFVKGNIKPLIVTLCDGTEKPFLECTTWELLNLTPDTVMDLSKQLGDLYGVSQTALSAAMKPYSIQETGKDWLEVKFDMKKESIMLIGTTAHYSWPKGGAIAGIGAKNIIKVGIDLNARMDPDDLRTKLNDCLKNQVAVYSVVAIMGSTEQGAVDPLKKILEIRSEFQTKGLSFIVHCDAAWGGYFASMLERGKHEKVGFGDEITGFVPRQSLSPYTYEQLEAFKDADSITIDPHKSGLCPYPAGGLCYRDGRLRFLVTWTSPIVYRSGDESIGVYGVEGSKPGAAPVGAWMSHEVIGLHPNGYGTLLGEGIYTCAKLYANWATLSTDKDTFIVTPFTMLPGEAAGASPQDLENEKQFIRDRIVNVDNQTLYKDKEAWALLSLMGSDLMINALACNFKYYHGDEAVVNKSIVEANIMNTKIFNRLSVIKKGTDINSRPLFLTSSQFAQKDYETCLDNYKKRLQVEGPDDLYSLVNVTMSPWSTDGNFLSKIVASFKEIVQEEAEYALARNTISPDLHGFVMQGDSPIYFVHLPMFNMKNHRYQLIITGEIPDDVMEKYKADKAANPDAFYLLGNKNPDVLEKILEDGEFDAIIDKGFPPEHGPHWIEGFKLTNIKVVVKKSLELDDLKKEYPQISDQKQYPIRMPFYLYGSNEQIHIDHVLAWSPDVQLNSSCITLDIDGPKSLDNEQLQNVVVCVFDGLDENIMQPIANDPGAINPNTHWQTPALPFFRGNKFTMKIYKDYISSQDPSSTPMASGQITLGSSFADWDMTNDIPDKPGAHAMMSGSLAPGLASEHPIHGIYKELANRRRITVAKEWTMGYAPLAANRTMLAGSLSRAHPRAAEKIERKNVTLDDF
ncbi:hypothetical protein ABW20_dc0110203 [Dactylellina cionopaga]|nr:hypothetical protein ABW20_dc0110203 [Dactylellina cionopaga]